MTHVKKKKKGTPITQGRITMDQYMALRSSFYENGSITRAAKAAGLTYETAKEYVDRPYPAFGGPLSIRKWAEQERQENATTVLRRGQLMREATMVAVQGSQHKMLSAFARAVPKIKGELQPDGTISIDLDEMYRALRNIGMQADIIRKGEADMLGRTGNPAPGVNVNVNVDNRQQVAQFGTGFQGQQDRGPFFPIPENPETLFERGLHIGKANPVLARVGTSDHRRLVNAVRQGHEIREQMEAQRLASQAAAEQED